MKKVVMALTIGNANPNTGTTMYDWGIYDEFWNGKMWVFLCNSRLVFSSSEDDFEIGDVLEIRGNDSGRKLNTLTVKAKCVCERETLLKMLLDNEYDYYPKRAFTKARFSRKLDSSYSVKGISNE